MADGRIRFLIAGAGTGAHWNAGDAAILAAMTRQLRGIEPAAEVLVASANPPGTLASHGVTEVRYDDIPALVSAARSADLLLLGGGGLFFDYWGFPTDQLLTPDHDGLSFYAGFAMLATLFAKPLAIYAAGVGPLRSADGKRFTRAAFEQADAITVRDRESAAALIGLGIDGERITVAADPAYALASAAATRVAEILGSAPDPPLLGVALRQWTIDVDGEAWQRELARSLDRFVDRQGGTVLFVPFHKAIGDVSDVAIAERVRGLMHHRKRARVLSPEHTPQEISGIIGRCDALVGMRLHSIIFARTHAVPFVAIDYDQKVRGALDGELLKLSIPLPELSTARLDALLAETWSRRAAISSAMLEERPALVAGAAAHPAAIGALLRRGGAAKAPGPATASLLTSAVVGQLARVAELEQSVARMRGEAQQRQEAITWLEEEVRIRDAQIGAQRSVRS
jgi:polysaccharide pyruvyl transferase CsaB